MPTISEGIKIQLKQFQFVEAQNNFRIYIAWHRKLFYPVHLTFVWKSKNCLVGRTTSLRFFVK